MSLVNIDWFIALDNDYYLSQQILPPVERLCEPIEGIDRARLAECLGQFGHEHTLFMPGWRFWKAWTQIGIEL